MIRIVESPAVEVPIVDVANVGGVWRGNSLAHWVARGCHGLPRAATATSITLPRVQGLPRHAMRNNAPNNVSPARSFILEMDAFEC